MTTQVIVIEGSENWGFEELACPVIDIDDYLTSNSYFSQKNLQIINFCRDYSYSSVGYYCSLLAEARGHKVIPSVKSMLDLSSKAMYSLDMVNLDDTIARAFKKYNSTNDKCDAIIFFGQCRDGNLLTLSRRIFETFPYPLLRVQLRRLDQWRITHIHPLTLQDIKANEFEFFKESFKHYLAKRWRTPKQKTHCRYDLAILHDPEDPLPPSNKKALSAFVKAGKKFSINVELIDKRDFSRLAEYDALFIRDTTRINHYTYRFAKKAESEGMVVIDDPTSILRCTNKVYLAELLRANNIATPRSVILGRKDLDAAEAVIGYPMVLKVPEGAFSLGVFKAENREEFNQITQQLFTNSELIVAQEYLYTEYDWRIGVLNRKPIYACQYFMYKNHWQIVKHADTGTFNEGAAKTWPIAETPKKVVDIAVKAASLIGNGLYGVDVKQSKEGIYVIEINDNPNVDKGVEDVYLGQNLYELIMEEFLRRLGENK